MKTIKYKLSAYTAAAGKYDREAPNKGNEDNFYVDDNLSDDLTNHCQSDGWVESSELGLLMAVADGMGGMNAGEVASEIAINTVADCFSPGKIDRSIASDREKRAEYLEQVIVEADRNIKNEAKANSEHRGMGSTIILAWIVGNEVSVSWCGDSRCYRFNPGLGIELLSNDHSYVQELADKGVITYEQTFGHPQGNIVTRSLGDFKTQAEPESRCFRLYDNDIVMLCSDGLSGVLFDRAFYLNNRLLSDENIETIIRNNQENMDACKDALFAAAEKADWYDNVTVTLCKICSGAGAMPPRSRQTLWELNLLTAARSRNSGDGTVKIKKWLMICIPAVLLSVAAVFFFFLRPNDPDAETAGGEQAADSATVAAVKSEDTVQTDRTPKTEEGESLEELVSKCKLIQKENPVLKDSAGTIPDSELEKVDTGRSANSPIFN